MSKEFINFNQDCHCVTWDWW